MITRIRIKLGADTVLDLAEHEAFSLDGTDYPADWIEREGVIPGHTIEPYDATPPPPPPQEPRATAAQIIDEANAQSKLVMLTAALTPFEMTIFVTRRRIVAGSGIAEVLRARLGVSKAAMVAFIAAASVRSED